MKSAMPAAQLPELWQSITSQVGAFKSQRIVRHEQSGTHDVVFVSCQFDRASLDIELVFNDKQEIAGLFFGPSSLLVPAASAPQFVDQNVRENIRGIWRGSLYAGAFISRLFAIPMQPSDILKPLQIYNFFHERMHSKSQL